jgi:HAMP domain-containing protein
MAAKRATDDQTPASPPKPEPPRGATPTPVPRKRGVGLRGKMFFLFFFIPMCLIVASSLFYLNHMQTLSTLITKESFQLVTKMAEEAVADKARAVARETQLYLETHPTLKREAFNTTPEFRNIVMQPVGQTGYTVIASRATETEPEYMWVHPDPALVGIDIAKTMKERLGNEYERWRKIEGKPYEIGGYYKWFDGRERYTYSVPVKGTNFNIASTTHLEEFTLPMTKLDAVAKQMAATAERTVTVVLAITAVLIAISVVIYSYRLSGQLKSLADVADRISVGDLDAEIGGGKSKDEIGELVRAISRMQGSIRLAIKRLRERR